MSDPHVPGAASARAAGSTDSGLPPPDVHGAERDGSDGPDGDPAAHPRADGPAAPDAAGERRDVERRVVGAGVDGVVQGAGQVGAHRVTPVGTSWMSMVCASGSGPSRDSSWPIASKR